MGSREGLIKNILVGLQNGIEIWWEVVGANGLAAGSRIIGQSLRLVIDKFMFSLDEVDWVIDAYHWIERSMTHIGQDYNQENHMQQKMENEFRRRKMEFHQKEHVYL